MYGIIENKALEELVIANFGGKWEAIKLHAWNRC
jgi:hypothetical protein